MFHYALIFMNSFIFFIKCTKLTDCNNGNTVLATKENTQTSISHIPRKYEGRVFWSSSRIGNIICQRNTFRLIPRNTPPSLPIVCNTIRIYELNTISFVNGHKKWYWHAEKEAEQSKKDEQCEYVKWKDVALTNPLSEKRK